MKKIFILLNPSSAGGRTLKNKDKMEEALLRHHIPYEIKITESEEHLRLLVRELAPLAAGLVAAGGDSTLTIIAHELLANEIDLPVGVIPLGSSDDIALDWGAKNLDEAAALLAGPSYPVDAGAIYDRSNGEKIPRLVHHFIGQCNAGIGVEINRNVARIFQKHPRLRPFQSLVGLYSMIQAFSRHAVPIEVEIKGNSGGEAQLWEGGVVSALFGKIRYWAGGKLYVPDASPDNGLLQMVLLKRASLAETVVVTLKSSKGNHLSLAKVETAGAKTFLLSAQKPFSLQLDGDIYPQEFSCVEIKTIGGRLRAFRRPR